jgi:hypothetical protein
MGDLTYTTTETSYTILLNGVIWIVQDNGYFPYAGETMADKAQAHIAAIIAEWDAEKSAKTDLQKLQNDLLNTQLTIALIESIADYNQGVAE